jgi:polysaccharide export outer membrane protein
MLKSTSLVLLAALVGFAAAPNRADQAPKELIEYLRQARNAGLKEPEIRKNAETAGWPEGSVTDALEATRPAKHSTGPEKPPKAAVNHATATTDGGRPEPALPTSPASPAAAVKPEVRNRNVADDYIIGAGDVLQINVWKEPDASVASAMVRPEGKISMPLLKEVSVIGLTPAQAEEAIAQQLAKFINTPDVTIVVSAINSKKIYVLGAVKKEGPIAYTYRMTVMQALSEAGGITDYAKRKKIYVLRNQNGRDFRISFDYDAVLRGERMETNIPLLAGDTLVVPH